VLGSFLELHAVLKKVFEQLNSGDASFPRATVTSSTRRSTKRRKIGVGHSFLSSSRPRWCDLQNTQKCNRQSLLVFLSFVFRSASLPFFLCFGSAPLQIGSFSFLFPLLYFRWLAV
jgi:hypothetical protein